MIDSTYFNVLRQIHARLSKTDASVSDDRGLDVVQVTLDDLQIHNYQTNSDAAQKLKDSNRTLLSFKVLLILREGENRGVITARDNNREPARRSISLIY